ncbi:MAG: PPC domain-containing protein [Acidobacteria bacterium]|nr:PPC domain-containing protein [Acidobacteriota bacterium]
MTKTRLVRLSFGVAVALVLLSIPRENAAQSFDSNVDTRRSARESGPPEVAGSMIPHTIGEPAALGREAPPSEIGSVNRVEQGVPEVLQVDDGSFEQPIGFPNGPQTAYFLNRLTPSSYPSTLRNIQINFAGRANGLRANDPISVLFGVNPSGSQDIRGLTFQRIATFIGFLNGFNQFILPEQMQPTIRSGDFVVGFLTNNPPSVYPADQDTTPPSKGRSYAAVSESELVVIDTYGSSLAGNFGIRATVVPGEVISEECNPQPVNCPATIPGSLDKNDCASGRRGAGYLVDRYQFTGSEGQSVRVDHASFSLDAYLYLISPAGLIVAENDDGGGGTNARIEATVTSSGLWTVEVTSFEPGEVGGYDLTLAGCSSGDGGTNNPPTLLRVDISRTTCSHGRLDSARAVNGNPVGIRSVFNPGGRCVPGITPVALSTLCQAAAGIELVPPICTALTTPRLAPSILEAIASQPSPRRITFDNDRDGQPDPGSPMLRATCAMPSSFTLAIAEGIGDSDGDSVAVRWQYPGTRFDSGNLYATVDVPSAGIVAGMELVTSEQLAGYDANSILWEAPDAVFGVQGDSGDGGLTTLTARVIDIPPAPASALLSEPQSRDVEYGGPLRPAIREGCKRSDGNGNFRIRLVADLPPRGFEYLDKVWFRWVYEGRSLTIIGDVPAANTVEFYLPESEVGASARVTVVASSFGSAVAGNPNPFLSMAPIANCRLSPCSLNAGQQGALNPITFASRGSTTFDVEPVLVEELGGEVCADGLDNDCDGQLDEDCNFNLLVSDGGCPDDTFEVRIDGLDLGQTPAGQSRFFDIAQFAPGEHALVIDAVASGGAAYGCTPDSTATYRISLIGGVLFVLKEDSNFTGTSDSGQISVGAQARYTIRIP